MSEKKSRLQEGESTLDTITRLSESNAGAMEVLIAIVNRSFTNKNYSTYLVFYTLERLNIRGAHIHNLYNACNNNPAHLMLLFHGFDHKFIDEKTLLEVAKTRVTFRFDLGKSCFNFDHLRDQLKNKVANLNL